MLSDKTLPESLNSTQTDYAYVYTRHSEILQQFNRYALPMRNAAHWVKPHKTLAICHRLARTLIHLIPCMLNVKVSTRPSVSQSVRVTSCQPQLRQRSYFDPLCPLGIKGKKILSVLTVTAVGRDPYARGKGVTLLSYESLHQLWGSWRISTKVHPSR